MDVVFRAFDGPTDWGVVKKYSPEVKRVEDTKGITAIDRDTNSTVAIVVLDTWTAGSVNMHWIIIKKMVLRHGLMDEVMDYVFNHAGRSTILGIPAVDNWRSMKLAQHVGFEEMARVPDMYGEGLDGAMMMLTKQGWQS